MFDDERTRFSQDRRVPLSERQSLTVILPVRDAEACQRELARRRSALEHGWAAVPGQVSACLAILPADYTSEAALLLECSFETEFAEWAHATFAGLGGELSAVFGHCEGYPELADARAFTEYLGSRAQRSFAFASRPAPVAEFELWRSLQRLFDAFSAPRASSPVIANEPALEARHSAVGMQEPVPGVPLLHVAWLRTGARARARLMRALRELHSVPALVEHDARFLLAGQRLVFVAYPSEGAQRWSERLSHVALDACTRIWRNCRGFAELWGARRGRRERRLSEFVLEHRVPVGAWFNARPALRGARPES